jgi:HAAS domain-containing protein
VTLAAQDELIGRYLQELRTEAGRLGPSERHELVGSIEEHIAEALGPDAGEAEVRTALERLGQPAQVVEDSYGPAPALRDARGRLEWAAILLLPVGGLVIPFVGWLAGVLFLWSSSAWTTREKLAGTLIVPGGLMLPLWGLVVIGAGGGSCMSSGGPGVATVTHCTGSPSTAGNVALIVFAAVAIIGPLVMAAFLARQAGRRTRPL